MFEVSENQPLGLPFTGYTNKFEVYLVFLFFFPSRNIDWHPASHDSDHFFSLPLSPPNPGSISMSPFSLEDFFSIIF